MDLKCEEFQMMAIQNGTNFHADFFTKFFILLQLVNIVILMDFISVEFIDLHLKIKP